MGNHRKLRQNILAGNGETYTLGVGIVRHELPDGTPRFIELIGMDEKVDLRDPANRKFVTLYLPKHMVKRQLQQPPEPDQPSGSMFAPKE